MSSTLEHDLPLSDHHGRRSCTCCLDSFKKWKNWFRPKKFTRGWHFVSLLLIHDFSQSGYKIASPFQRLARFQNEQRRSYFFWRKDDELHHVDFHFSEIGNDPLEMPKVIKDYVLKSTSNRQYPKIHKKLRLGDLHFIHTCPSHEWVWTSDKSKERNHKC